MLVFRKVFTSWISGKRVESVVCEKCRTQFHYELTRTGKGKGSALYNLFQDSAKHRAEVAAQRDLVKRLDTEAELVPCPRCHWVNEELVGRYRKRMYRRAPWLVGGVILAGLVAAPIIKAGLMLRLGGESKVPDIAMAAIWVVSLLSPLWILSIRQQLRLRINPNQTYPRRPTLPPGTPPALVQRRDPNTNEIYLEPVPNQEYEVAPDTEWAVYRPGDVAFPPICCICLAEATTHFKPPMEVSENSIIPVPLCRPCLSRLRLHWWFNVLVAILVGYALAGLAALIVRGMDNFGRWAFFIVVGFGVSIVAVAITMRRFGLPYRFGIVDADRGIVKFSARNPGYTRLLIEQTRQSQGLESGGN